MQRPTSRTNGADTIAHAEKWERDSAALCSGIRPTSSMSGYAQQPGLDIGWVTFVGAPPCFVSGERKGTTVIKLDMTRSHKFTMSPEVRKVLYGHQPGPICPGSPPSVMFWPWWQFSIAMDRDDLLKSS